MRTQRRAAEPADIGFLLDQLRLAGAATYADLAATLNRQGISPRAGTGWRCGSQPAFALPH
jgi:hypothetical protein